MKITKATRWKVFAGVWIQSLFTSATAFFSLFALPLTTQFGWSSSEFSMAYTIYMFVYCAVGFVGGLLAEKLQPRVAIYLGLVFFAAGWFLNRQLFVLINATNDVGRDGPDIVATFGLPSVIPAVLLTFTTVWLPESLL